jgi:hypothetical protein
MSAFGLIHDAAGPVAWVEDGRIYRDGRTGELIGYEEDGKVLDLKQQYVGQLGPVRAGTGTSVIRRLLEGGE